MREVTSLRFALRAADVDDARVWSVTRREPRENDPLVGLLLRAERRPGARFAAPVRATPERVPPPLL